MQSFKYLRFVFNQNGNYREQIKDLCRKGRIATNAVWRVGERICKFDYRRRWTLFNYLVRSVMKQGIELWSCYGGKKGIGKSKNRLF